MSDNFQYDVFLSHNSEDKPLVRNLAERLKEAGLKVWLDESVIQPGDIISLKVDEGLEQSRVLLLCLSPAALASDWVALERSTAIHRDPTNAGRRFVPLLLADCEMPDTLRRYKHVDFRSGSKTAFAELLTACESQIEPLQDKQTGGSRTTPTVKNANSVTLLKEVLHRKQQGHDGPITSIVVSPDGKWAASGSEDRTIRIWDLQTGWCDATLHGHKDAVLSVAISLNGKRLFSASRDQMFRTWNADLREKLTSCRLDLFERIVRILPMDQPDSVVVVGDSSGLTLIDTKTLLRLRQVEIVSLLSGSVTPDGKQAVVGLRTGVIQHWQFNTSTLIATSRGHTAPVNSIEITPNGRFAVSGSSDTTVKVWDLKTHLCVWTLEGHQDAVCSVAISHDGALIASAGDDTIRLWDRHSGLCLQVISHEGPADSVAFSPDGSQLVVATKYTNTICIYRLTDFRPVLAAETTRQYVNAKVVLIGEGSVGKTSLAHRLIDDQYVVQDRSHGMNVWRLELQDSDSRNLFRESNATLTAPDVFAEKKSTEHEALLWDLAGQEYYRLIHQLFLDETALAILLVNPQKDDPFAEAGDWLKALQSVARNQDSKREAARLLIFSQIDVGGMKLSNAKIERFRERYGFAGWLPTSAKTGENCSDKKNNGKPSKLKQLIADSIPWDKLPWTSTPRLLAEMKNAVMSMRDATDIRLLRFRELAQRLEQMLPADRFGESDVRTAVTLLANHGLARLLKFGDLVLLRPDLLNGYAGAIIRAAGAHTDEIGCVLEADIYLPDFDFTGVERLTHRPDEELLLRALVQTFLDHSLCIAEETPQGRHLVFPSQYRREKDIPHEPDIFVSYSFSGEWQTVWTTLVVRLWYSNEFERRELWSNAAEFAFSGRTLGLKIDNQQGEGKATISLYFDRELPDELKAIFIEYAHRHLAKYASDVTRDRRYVCNGCGRHFKDLDVIRELLAEKQSTIVCQKCRTEVELIDFIEQRLKSDPVARKILAMEETTTRELDTQALEQILIGHMMAIAGEANQIFRPVTMFDHGIDGEVEFKDNDGRASGKRIYIQLKSGNTYLRTRKRDGREVFDVKNERHLEYWISQPVDVYLVIRQRDEMGGDGIIRWMNVTRYLQNRKKKRSRQIIFDGQKLDMNAVWRVRDEFFPPAKRQK